MAVYVLMQKLEDNKEKVVYKFGPNEKDMGIIEFNKAEKKFSIEKKLSNDDSINKAYERWAAEKIVKIMYKEDGVFPDITSVEK